MNIKHKVLMDPVFIKNMTGSGSDDHQLCFLWNIVYFRARFQMLEHTEIKMADTQSRNNGPRLSNWM